MAKVQVSGLKAIFIQNPHKSDILPGIVIYNSYITVYLGGPLDI